MSRVCPDSKANIAQVLTLSWLTPLLRLGARRPLEEQDLWELDEARHADRLGNRLETLFYERAPPFKRPSEGHRRVPEEHGVGDDLARSAIEGSTDGLAPANKTKYDMSLILAIYHAFAFRIWWTGLLLLVPGALNITTPLVTKLLIQYVTDAFNARSTPSESELKPASYGYGLAVAVFAMQQVASICHNQSYYGTLIFGFLLRTSLIPVVFRKALRLSGRARAEHTAGQITTIISADITRLDNASGFIHVLWYSPLLIIVVIALLIVNIGPSALVGLATLVASIPIQGYFVGKMMNLRGSNVQSTDRRVRLLQEVLQGMRVLVLFNWRTHYMERIMGMRKTELANIRKLSVMRGLVTATTTFMPILAAILTFITYSLTGHDLDPATIFSSLQLFNVITTPLTLFPLAAAAISDGLVSLRRIRNLLLAEDIAEIPGLDYGDAPSAGSQPAKVGVPAISVHGSFTWERAAPTADSAPNAAKSASESEKEYARLIARWAVGENVDKYSEESASEGPPPFALENIALDIKPGSFVAIVGRVASGKSSLLQAQARTQRSTLRCFAIPLGVTKKRPQTQTSLLQAVIGEMRRTAGRVEVDGKISYSPQSPWIQNATLRDNILFGQPYNEQRYAEVVRSCALEHDIASFPQGDATEIGERGVNLSGGQKARVSLARAAYQQPDIILLDDPLSAVDARVSNHIVDEYLHKGPMASKTRILVTHNLQVLPLADEIICMDKGCAVERGTFDELLERQGAFARMIAEFGPAETRGDALDSLVHDRNESLPDPQKAAGLQAADAPKQFAGDERNVGAVSGSAYLAYIRCAGGLHWALALLFGLVIAQGATVSSTIVLGFWTQGSISGFNNGEYMALYAGLGAGTAVLTFMAAIGFAQAGFTASLRLFGGALKGAMFTNIQWHEKTPTGAITNRLSKDIDTLDTSLPRNMMSLLQDVASICGTVALVFYSFAWLGLIFPPLAILYWFISAWYRRTNVEIRRIDAGLRTRLYASFTEALTGISTIRAHHAENIFITECEAKLDAENKASLIGRAAPVWLSLYMDVLSNLLVLGVGLFAVGFREKTNPAKMAVVLTYSLNLATIMMFTAQIYASVEADMNAVERIEVYARLPAESQDEEADGQVEHVEPSWPSEGSIRFDAVELRYGDHLPPAIKGISFAIRPGERIAVVGRTGAGKSSILGALFRVTPALSKGHILVDGIDIKQVSRQRLRKGLAIIPQDTVLINGTLRSNIDPEGRAPDIELFAALKRVGLADPNGKFALDRHVDQDAFSAGEKQLLAICRAMVRTDARILVLDEATSNVDVATDALVQQLIREDFKDKTLLCIAHRLSTILYYDRVLVMHDGELAECDTPLALYDAGGLFHSMCEKASIRRDDIVRAGAF